MKDELMKLGTQGVPYGIVRKMMCATFNTTFTKGSIIGMAHRIGVPLRPPVIVKKDKPYTIVDLELGMCKWPLPNEADRPPYFFCGEPTIDLGCSWCEEHRNRAFQRVRF